MFEVRKYLNYNHIFFSARVIFPYPCTVYMYKVMTLLNDFSSKFHVDPTVEMELRVCSNGHAALTVLSKYVKNIRI